MDTIVDHEQRFIKGRLATWTPAKTHTDFAIIEQDCSLGLELGDDDTSLDDEILQEILEEEARQKAEDTPRKNVMGSKKKSKKGKKKSNKKAKKDEL